MSNLDKYNRTPTKPAPALRSVPISAKLAVLFGGVLQPVGWLVIGFSMIFVWAFAMNADFSSLSQFGGELTETRATVTASERTSFSEGGSNTNPGTPIYRVSYSFTEGGQTWEGESYTLGSGYSVGSSAPVEFPAGKPSVSRIVGARGAPFGVAVLFVLVFPIVGFVLVLIGFRGGLSRAILLNRGKLARGRLTDKQATATKVNDQTVYRMTFEFEAEDGRTHTCEARTHNTHLLEDEENGELILYHPANPKHSFAVDLLPAGVKITEEGEYKVPSMGALLFALLPPFLAVGIHGTYAAIAYL